ncbi:hypothetical protein NKJ88_06270 [Mesorhizobium sp. M0016]|uniref:hypothetical protein n=1 Tax=Mesorhizobium sp. M0016 TaxID=2956843 RepID=UPI00333CAE84
MTSYLNPVQRAAARQCAEAFGITKQEATMTPKQKYDERRRLRIENDLRAEQKREFDFDRDDEMQRQFMRVLSAVERIAEVMELWADKQ